MYKHILLATELGDDALYVEDKAAVMKKFTHAKLSIIHVIEPLPYILDDMINVYNEELSKAITENARKLLQPVKERLDIPDSYMIIATGKVSTEILLYAEKRDVDLIIIGSHGRHGLQLILGSTANAVLHAAKCDVLAVRYKS